MAVEDENEKAAEEFGDHKFYDKEKNAEAQFD